MRRWSMLPLSLVHHGILRWCRQVAVRSTGIIASRLNMPPSLPRRGPLISINATSTSVEFHSRRLRCQYVRRMRKNGISSDAINFRVYASAKNCLVSAFVCGGWRIKSNYSRGGRRWNTFN